MNQNILFLTNPTGNFDFSCRFWGRDIPLNCLSCYYISIAQSQLRSEANSSQRPLSCGKVRGEAVMKWLKYLPLCYADLPIFCRFLLFLQWKRNWEFFRTTIRKWRRLGSCNGVDLSGKCTVAKVFVLPLTVLIYPSCHISLRGHQHAEKPAPPLSPMPPSIIRKMSCGNMPRGHHTSPLAFADLTADPGQNILHNLTK